MTFTTICADPAWNYNDKLADMKTAGPGAEAHYACLSLPGIAALATGCDETLRIAGHRIADDAFLWLWITTPFLVNEPWQDVVRAWDFEPKTLITWVKGRFARNPHDATSRLVLAFGQGRYTRGCTEHLILATRGKASRLVKAHNLRNVILAPRGAHSAKPEASYQLIESVSPGPYLELFARKTRPGWRTWGNEVKR